MKMLTKLSVVLLFATIVVACSANKEQTENDSTDFPPDTATASEDIMIPEPDHGTFAGEYLIGDGNTYIVPVADTWEMRDGTGKTSDVFYFEGKENDTLSVYSNKDKSVTFKMNPGHRMGRYYADGEELPVELVDQM